MQLGPTKTTSEISLPRYHVEISPVDRLSAFQKGVNPMMKPLSSSKVKLAPLINANSLFTSVL